MKCRFENKECERNDCIQYTDDGFCTKKEINEDDCYVTDGKDVYHKVGKKLRKMPKTKQ